MGRLAQTHRWNQTIDEGENCDSAVPSLDLSRSRLLPRNTALYLGYMNMHDVLHRYTCEQRVPCLCAV